jgi:hypothetical protein
MGYSVPDLEFDVVGAEGHGFGTELHSDRHLMLVAVAFVRVLEEEAGLAYALSRR